jgi:hypothetical protein
MNIRRVRKNIFHFLIHPAIWSIPVALIVFWLIPPLFDKYEVEEISETRINPDTQICYYDLDADGLSEEIITGDQENDCFVKLIYLNGKSHQINLKGKYAKYSDRMMVGDYDNNGKQEVYLFTMTGDSVLLHALDFCVESNINLFNSVLICRMEHRNGYSDAMVRSGKVTDLNGDGTKEVVFAVNAGFGRQPRGIFAYDFVHDTVTRTAPMGVYCNPVFGDLDKDGLDEIAIGNYAISNFNDKNDSSVPFNDWYHYNMVLDNDLTLLFQPQRFEGDFGGISFLIDEKNPDLIASRTIISDTNQIALLAKYNLKGELINELKITYKTLKDRAHFILIRNKNADATLLIYPDLLPLELYSTDFKHLATSNIKSGLMPHVNAFDLDVDGNDEIIAQTPLLDKFAILRGDFSDVVYFHLISMPGEIHFYHNNRGKYGENQIVIQAGDVVKVITYEKNPFYWLKYPLLLLIYFSFFGIFYIFRKIQRKQAIRKYEAEAKFAELQLVSFRNQFEPHFMFNILTNIGSMMLNGRQQESYQMLMKFSKLLRSILMSSNKVNRSLAEELSFTIDYVNLQLIRFAGFFQFEVNIQEGIDQQRLVPKMVLQTYVENAIKHGLSRRGGGGKLQLEIKEDVDKNLVFSITDNGIGRTKAAEFEMESTGKGMHIMKQYYNLLNKNNKLKITETIIDLFTESGQSSGTQIIVIIPNGFQFEK